MAGKPTPRTAQNRRTPGAWGTVEQLPSGRWRAFYRKDGAKFTAPHTFDTKDTATAWLAGERSDRHRGTWRDPSIGRLTLAEYADTWLDARPDLTPRTRSGYRHSLDRWVLPRVGGTRGMQLGSYAVADLTLAVVRRWYALVFADARESALQLAAKRSERKTHPARLWAEATGLAVGPTGRLSPVVLEAWQRAGSPLPAAASAQITDDAGRTSAAHAYRVLRNLLNTAVQDGLLRANPCQIASAGVVHHRERGTATPAEVAALAAAMPARYSAAVTLAAWSGLRYGELFALARRHVDLDTGTLRVERSLMNLPGQAPSLAGATTGSSAITSPRSSTPEASALRCDAHRHPAGRGDRQLRRRQSRCREGRARYVRRLRLRGSGRRTAHDGGVGRARGNDVKVEAESVGNTILDSGSETQVVVDTTVNAFRATPTMGL